MKKVIVFLGFLKIIFMSMLFIKVHGGRTIGWFTLGKKSGVSRGTISRLCQTEHEEGPTMKNARKTIKALREITGKNVYYDNFWSM
ncbi:hypothetical protein [Metabacillus rhizolycopersici]|uniref:HTH cro/C1-type domain-containing protein n=1 Tax=Metabacillus rhizolycopersici TaxID=2875709 RepID=A0ABS7UY73_9BACI|nr:hypothetical protein [Metabacillus rhizolycopersici]MBZ5753260.1 hypothetical protein [Metabacillus rhizolycopersici]